MKKEEKIPQVNTEQKQNTETIKGPGMLYLVATPIGNLGDITLRALETLKSVDIVAAEDTRQTLKLLNHFEIKKPLVSYYEHNKNIKGGYILKMLSEGKNVALVSDAGSPGISDPGEDMVKLAVEHGINVTMVPGAVAAVTGLVLSGLATGRFVFEGFLPMNKRARKERINFLVDEVRTIILYEAPHKLIYTLKELLQILGDRNIALARELTKRYEQIIRCKLSEAVEMYTNEPPRGEYVIVIEGIPEESLILEKRQEWEEMSIEEHVNIYINQGMDKKSAIKQAAQDRGASRRDIYNSLLEKDQ